MKWYRLELFKPQEPHPHRRDILASNDTDAIRRADYVYDGFASTPAANRYVLYEDDRVVRERVGPKGKP